MTAEPSRPPDTAERQRCTTFTLFIHISTRSSNEPIPGTLWLPERANARRRCHSQQQVPGARRWRTSGWSFIAAIIGWAPSAFGHHRLVPDASGIARRRDVRPDRTVP
jgi:hypothetical protein